MRPSLKRVLVPALAAVLAFSLSDSAFCQSLNANPSSGDSGGSSVARTPTSAAGLGKVGIGVKASLLGGGVELAAAVSHRTNVRGGFNMLSYNRGFDKDQVSYDGKLSFKTIEAHYDIFPFAGRFHLGPGVLVYAGDPLTATASVPEGQSFSLGGEDYISAKSNPVRGSGKLDFNRAAPTVTLGWGNLVSRREKRFSIPVELGVAFQGSPKATLNLTGSVCDINGSNCRTIASDPTVQAQVVSEQSKVNNSISAFKYYPLISFGFGVKF